MNYHSRYTTTESPTTSSDIYEITEVDDEFGDGDGYEVSRDTNSAIRSTENTEERYIT